MTLLITRPAPDCYQLAEQLDLAGISAIAQPLLYTEQGKDLNALVSQLQQLQAGDYLIAVSHHAVQFAANHLISLGAEWPKNIHYIAVGHKTATTLSKATGQNVLSPKDRFDSEGLLALPELANIHQRKVLILRGNGGRELIHQVLTERQASVDYCETYQRCWLDLNIKKLIVEWQHLNLSGIVVTSGEQLVHLTELIPNKDLSWFLHCQLFVPSQRIAEQAHELGFADIYIVGSADNQALFTFLSNLS